MNLYEWSWKDSFQSLSDTEDFLSWGHASLESQHSGGRERVTVIYIIQLKVSWAIGDPVAKNQIWVTPPPKKKPFYLNPLETRKLLVSALFIVDVFTSHLPNSILYYHSQAATSMTWEMKTFLCDDFTCHSYRMFIQKDGRQTAQEMVFLRGFLFVLNMFNSLCKRGI